MDPISLGMAALSAGTGLWGAMQKKGKKASYDLNLPTYTPSPYDASSSASQNAILQDRLAGRNVGYSPEDLATMNEQAVDQFTKSANDMLSRSMAGRQQTGGVTKGGTNVAREQAYMYGGGLKANSLRDIAINNAVQKRTEINAAIPENQQFLNSERTQAETLYNNKMQQAMLQKEEADKVQAYNTARNDASTQDITGLIGGLSSGFSGNANPYGYGYAGAGGTAGGSDIMSRLFGGTRMNNMNAATFPLGQWFRNQFGQKSTGKPAGAEGMMG